MSRSKHSYIELDGRERYVLACTKDHKGIDDLKEIIELNFNDVLFSNNDRTFTHNVDGKVMRTLLLRLTPSGDDRDLVRKRAQINNNYVKNPIDDCIVVYEFKTNLIFLRVVNPATCDNLPNNITTLFWIHIDELKLSGKTSLINKKARRVPTDIIVSKNPKLLYSNSAARTVGFSPVIKNEQEKILEDAIPEEIYEEEEEKNKHIIGRNGEMILNNLLKEKSNCVNTLNDADNFIWINENGESFQPYDFKGDRCIVEVKSSSDTNSTNFIISNNEYEKMKEFGDKYFLVKINGVSDVEGCFQYKNIKIYDKSTFKNLVFTINSYNVKER